jgi:hypothetical protein
MSLRGAERQATMLDASSLIVGLVAAALVALTPIGGYRLRGDARKWRGRPTG